MNRCRFGNKVKKLASCIKEFKEIVEKTIRVGGSEDYSYMMKRVQSNGGRAVYMLFSSDIEASYHHYKFDFNEKDLINAVKMFSILTYDILKK